MRGRIDRRAVHVRLQIDSLVHRLRALADSPAALPIAFISGVLADRLQIVPGVRRVYGLLTGLVGPAQALQIASSLIGSPVR